MIKGIDKRDHEHLLRCLEELCTLTGDADEAHRIRMDITNLTGIYERYGKYLQKVEAQSAQYHAIFRDIEVETYRQLRKLRMKKQRSTPVDRATVINHQKTVQHEEMKEPSGRSSYLEHV